MYTSLYLFFFTTHSILHGAVPMLSSGDVQLEGLCLRKDAFRGLNLPIAIKGGPMD